MRSRAVNSCSDEERRAFRRRTATTRRARQRPASALAALGQTAYWPRPLWHGVLLGGIAGAERGPLDRLLFQWFFPMVRLLLIILVIVKNPGDRFT